MSSPRKAEFYVSAGDRLPALQITMSGITAEDLDGATAALVVRDEEGTESILTGAIIDAEALTATYSPTAEDIDDGPAGVLSAEQYLRARFLVTFASGKTAHFPNHRWLRVLVTD